MILRNFFFTRTFLKTSPYLVIRLLKVTFTHLAIHSNKFLLISQFQKMLLRFYVGTRCDLKIMVIQKIIEKYSWLILFHTEMVSIWNRHQKTEQGCETHSILEWVEECEREEGSLASRVGWHIHASSSMISLRHRISGSKKFEIQTCTLHFAHNFIISSLQHGLGKFLFR